MLTPPRAGPRLSTSSSSWSSSSVMSFVSGMSPVPGGSSPPAGTPEGVSTTASRAASSSLQDLLAACRRLRDTIRAMLGMEPALSVVNWLMLSREHAPMPIIFHAGLTARQPLEPRECLCVSPGGWRFAFLATSWAEYFNTVSSEKAAWVSATTSGLSSWTPICALSPRCSSRYFRPRCSSTLACCLLCHDGRVSPLAWQTSPQPPLI